MKVIALSAFKTSGKDTVANYLCEKHDFKRVAFADPLKDLVTQIFGLERSDLDSPLKKEAPLMNLKVDPQDDFSRMIVNFMKKEFRTEKGKTSQVFFDNQNKGLVLNEEGKPEYADLQWTPRALAILLGSTFRSVDPTFWIKEAVKKIEHEKLERVVISDARYKSEMNQLKELFGSQLKTVRIHRFDHSSSSDPSEIDLSDYVHDFILENKGTKEELFQKVEELLGSI
jgi:hypothetical protein